MSYDFIPMDQKGWEWFTSQLPVHAVDDSCGIVAINKLGKYVGGCAYDNWTPTSVQAHFLVSNSIVIRSLYDICADFVFENRGRKLIYSLIPGNNSKSLRFFTNMGFRIVCRLEDAYAEGIDSVLVELRKENRRVLMKEAA